MTERPVQEFARAIRVAVIERSKRANVGHIGSSLSIADILAVLYGGVLDGDIEGAERDRFVLSKGHAALALYAALVESGRLDQSYLDAFCTDGSAVATHPDHTVPGIDFSTGSLGQGLSFGVGAALAARLDRSRRRTFVLLSDAELNEGSVWEAAMFAAHHGLGKLVAIIDVNGQQAFGYTRDVLDLAPLAPRWESFGWDVASVDGHDVAELAAVLSAAGSGDRPTVVLANTTFGRGVGFMENEIRWHYSPLDDAQHSDALEQLRGDLR